MNLIDRNSREASFHDALLLTFHSGAIILQAIIVTVQVEESVDDVKRDLVLGGVSILCSMDRRGLSADHHFTMIKGDHICRPGDVHEVAVQPGDPRIGNNGNADLREPLQSKAAVRAFLPAFSKSDCRKPSQPTQIQARAPLEIPQLDHAADTGGTKPEPERAGVGVSCRSCFSPG